jgi:hypothetical protein
LFGIYLLPRIHTRSAFVGLCWISRDALFVGANSVRDAEKAGVKSRCCVKEVHENSSR